MTERRTREKCGWAIRGVIVVVPVLVSALLVIGMWVLNHRTGGNGLMKSDVPRMEDARPRTVKVELRSFRLWVEQVGSVRVLRELGVESRIRAEVLDVRVREGEWVPMREGGDDSSAVLVVLDDAEMLDRLDLARSRLAAAMRELELGRARIISLKAQIESARDEGERTCLLYTSPSPRDS